jgi:hypothetical protein
MLCQRLCYALPKVAKGPLRFVKGSAKGPLRFVKGSAKGSANCRQTLKKN